ncbi:hypothetical protein VAEKB19_7210001 [Vibrio aestuarianus]|nr:hypothetical protein VAEKB19_7210001 [Vibrio aestuarianus]
MPQVQYVTEYQSQVNRTITLLKVVFYAFGPKSSLSFFIVKFWF